ncbi:SH3 domain-binding glutamic acid-rich-like protein 3 [Echinococcus granulosus]|uniref:Sh3 domain binding glutamic acid rich n=2 Tax=Echinococcus TaxID=6209 RepID=A0A068WW60_ECHGR|nr:SH3 domain-binding glutamic acid-rich-like protein 3 [Echinococcus granulosus]CDS24347.1 sh3 domain binding glutamic acid rich [Echinococcus granulosus]CDS36183.1 SH3-binding, glutamic acid-rich protein [Echinococcus multilocularis]
MTLYLYVSTVSGNHEVRSNQQRVQSVLDSLNIKYQLVDIAADENAKHKMMAALKAANKQPPFLAPQIFFGDEYIGGYKEFEEAVEDSCLDAFLRI